MSARSAVLAATTVPDDTAFATIYEVPAGKTVLVKAFHVGAGGGTDRLVDLVANRPMGLETVNAWFLRNQALPVNSDVMIETWLVMGPGDKILARNRNGSPTWFWVSGSILEGVAS